METKEIKVYSNYGDGTTKKYISKEDESSLAEIYSLENGGWVVLTKNLRGDGFDRKFFPAGCSHLAIRRAEWGCHEAFPFVRLNFIEA